MKKYLYSILAVAAVLSACAKVDQVEKTVEPKDAEKASFYGTIEQPEGLTRTYILEEDDNAVSINWSAGDEIAVYGKATGTAMDFAADQDGENVYFGSSDPLAGDFLKENDGEGYSAYYPTWAYVENWFNGVVAPVLSCKSGYKDKADKYINQASLEYMPMYASLGTVSNPSHTYRQLRFSCAYHAILKMTVPASLDFTDMKVTENSTTLLATVTDIDKLEAVNGAKTKTIYVPIPAESYGQLTFTALKGGEKVAEMFTYNVGEALPVLSANTIYYFDYCNTLTINGAGEYDLVSNGNIDYKINIAADIDSDVTINAEVDGKEPANIYINNRGHQINGKLTINASKSHVEGENGIATEVEAKTSNSTFVVKPNLTITGLTVMKGSVVVEGTEDKTANVTTITIPENVTEQIKIDVSGVSSNDENGRVKIVNKSVTPVVVVPDNVGDNQKSYKVEEGPVTEAVAMIGTTGYATLAEAIEAATAGQTITLVKDVEAAAGISVASEKDFTVDFGGHTYAMECPGAGSAGTMTSGFQLLKNSTVVFKNGTIKCTDANKDKTWVKTDASKGIALMIQNYANLTLDGMTINATNIAHNGAATRYAISNNSGNVEFKGATSIISAAGDYAFDACKYYDYTKPVVTWNSTGTVNGVIELTGGDFIVAKDLVLSNPIETKDAASKLTVNAQITPDANWVYRQNIDALVIVRRTGDLTVVGTGKVVSANKNVYAAVKMTQKGESEAADAAPAKLTVDGNVTLEGYYYGIVGNGNRHNTEVTVNGGTVKGYNPNDNAGIYHPQNGTLTINGGTIEGAVGVYVKSGNVVTSVTGGTIKGVGEKASYVNKQDGLQQTGDAIVFDNCAYPGGVPNADIKGGTFTSTNASAVASYAMEGKEPIKGFISGGLFNTKPSGDLIASGYVAEQNADGMWAIVEGGNYVAKIGDTTYETLADAITAAKAGDVVSIVKADTYKIPSIKADITVEGAVGNVVFDCVGSGNIVEIPNGPTFKNVIMEFGQSGYHGFQHAGHITMDECTLNGLFHSYGVMTFNKCTFNQTKEEYNMWVYAGNVTYSDCTFNSVGKFLNVYNEGNDEGTPWEVVATNCVFNTTKANKAALNIKETCGATALKYNVTITNCTCNEKQKELSNVNDGTLYRVSPIWQVDDRKDGSTGINVTVDGQKVYPFCSKDADGNYHIVNASGLIQFHDLYAAAKVASTAKVYLENDIDFTGKE